MSNRRHPIWKDLPAQPNTTLILSPERKKVYQEMAKKMGISLNEFIRRGAELMLDTAAIER